MSDEDLMHRILRDLHHANEHRLPKNREEISDDVARVIASWWCPGDDTDAAAFVSTGAIPATLIPLWRAFVPDYRALSPRNRRAADYLGTYLLTHAGRGPVPGWANLWVRPATPERQ